MNGDKNTSLIRALRCSAKAGSTCNADCPYRLKEEVKPDVPIPADVVEDGIGYWLSCDYDRIALDAADALYWCGVNGA